MSSVETFFTIKLARTSNVYIGNSHSKHRKTCEKLVMEFKNAFFKLNGAMGCYAEGTD